MEYFKTEIAESYLKNIGNFKKTFIEPDLQDLRSPWSIPDFDKLIDFMESKISSGARFMVAGDSDVDGISSLSIVGNFLESKKMYVSKYIIPKSISDETGFYRKMLNDINKYNIQVLIIFDISLVPDFFLKLLNPNIKIAICDHHEIFNPPDVDFYINPKMSTDTELQQISSSGLAFKIVAQLLVNRNEFRKYHNEYLVLGMFGTLSDMVAITGENRTIVKLGMAGLLRETKYRKFFKNDRNIYYERVLFTIISYVNSLAKMGYAYEAMEFFNSENIDEKKYREFNKKSVKKKIKEGEALLRAALKSLQPEIYDSIFCIVSECGNTNLLGQIAFKLKAMKNANIIIMSKLTEDIYKGSIRVLDGYNAFEIVKSGEKRVLNFGGHNGAAGFIINKEQIQDFIEDVKDYLKQTDCKRVKCLEIFYKVRFREINHELISDIRKLAPFGSEFPPPLFFSNNVNIVSIQKFSPYSEHFKGYVKQDNQSFSVIGLNLADSVEEVFSSSQTFNILYEIGFSPYNSDKVQLKIKKIINKKDEFYDYFMKKGEN
ncbi:hypothetical protein KAJ27_03850 [bacterium]|nr:hypothetical protein [bacterium]